MNNFYKKIGINYFIMANYKLTLIYNILSNCYNNNKK